MEKVSKQEFYSLIKGFEQIPFKQTEAWVTAQSRHDDTKLAFFVDQLPEPLIACVAHVKKKVGLKMYYIEAEAIRYKDIKHAKLTSFFKICNKQEWMLLKLIRQCRMMQHTK